MTRARTRSVTTLREIREAMQKAPLTREEELVLRMRHGVSEPRTAALQFIEPGSAILAAELAAIEARAVARMATVAEDELEGNELKAAIIEKLKNL
jgi:hypothetical protein